MTISAGDTLPETSFSSMTDEGPRPRSVAEVFGGKKVVAFAVPGAFTPTCHRNHLPGFVEKAGEIRAKGVDSIVCIAVNDVFTMAAWAEASKSAGAVEMLADGDLVFTKAIGMDVDLSGAGAGLGTRSKRYAMIVEDGVVKALMVEDSPGKAEASTAGAVLEAL